jgi:hypothetical protein
MLKGNIVMNKFLIIFSEIIFETHFCIFDHLFVIQRKLPQMVRRTFGAIPFKSLFPVFSDFMLISDFPETSGDVAAAFEIALDFLHTFYIPYSGIFFCLLFLFPIFLIFFDRMNRVAEQTWCSARRL